MKRTIVATTAAALLAACGGGEDGAAADADVTADGPGPGGEAGAPGAPPPPLGPRPSELTLDLLARGPATSDVKAFGFAPRKVAFHRGKPAEPLFDGVPGEPMPCGAGVAALVTDAPAGVHVEFGATDGRLRLARLDAEHPGLVVEAWILVESGSAYVARPGGQLRAVHLPVCEDERGTIWSVVRAVPSRPLALAEGAAATATVDVRASSFIVEPADCSGSDAPAECASADDEGDDGDPGTRLVYLLHSVAMRAGP